MSLGQRISRLETHLGLVSLEERISRLETHLGLQIDKPRARGERHKFKTARNDLDPDIDSLDGYNE